jgi:glycosyltransferase involved in cell wall biosynthesis
MMIAGVEMSRTDRTYAWDRIEGGERFARHVLLEDVDAEPAWRVIARMEELLSELEPRAVAIPGWSHPAALAALAWCGRSGTPAVLMSESTAFDEPRRPWKEAVKRRLVARFGSALVGGQPHRRYLVELGMAPERVCDGYDVVDTDHFAHQADLVRRNAAEERRRHGLPERYFLASARFIKKKNLPFLIEAFAGYRRGAEPGAWDLVLLGDGEERPHLSAAIAQHGLDGAVHLPGFRQYTDLPAFYALAGAFVHASTTEQWGLVVNEAMAAGLPVLVSRHCGCVEDLVAEGENGHGFDPFNVEALTRLLRHVASDNCDRAAMAAAGRARIAAWRPERFAAGLRQAVEIAALGPRRENALDRLLLSALTRRKAAA